MEAGYEHLLEFSRLRKLHKFLRPVSLREDRDGRRTRHGRAAAAATSTTSTTTARDCGHYYFSRVGGGELFVDGGPWGLEGKRAVTLRKLPILGSRG